jgi:signal transduction histidine kinase/CheY-like chemotaxis protein
MVLDDSVFTKINNDDFRTIYRRTFHYISIVIAVAAQFSIIAADALFHPLPTLVTAALLSGAVVSVGCFVAYNSHPRTVAYLYGVLLWFWVVVLVTSGFTAGPYLFSVVVLIALGISGQMFAGVVTLASCIFLLLSTGVDAPVYMRFLYCCITSFTLLIGLLIFHSLLETLGIAWRYQHYAFEQMHEARTHRAELMHLTKALKDSQENLAHAYDQLEHARSAAEEARRLKAQFAANVSHEFRTPINLIVGFSEVIVNSSHVYDTPLPEAYWSDVQTIYESAQHLQGLINDVLDISQIEAGYMTVVKSLTDPRMVIMESATLVREMIENNRLSFHLNVPDWIQPLWLDRIRIRQVLLNLLSNAVRFTPTGSITLRATCSEQELQIQVIDTGQGIAAKDLSRVFDEFFQVEQTTSSKRGGSGLGLTLSKEFVEQHGGTLSVSSQGIPGLGSTFTITLPIDNIRAFSPRGNAVALNLDPQDSRQCFVVVDDDPAVFQLFYRYTKRHRALNAQTIEQAVDMVASLKPTAVVVGNEQAVDALTTVSPGAPYQTAIIRCPMPSGRRTMQSLGVSDYLVKPVSRDDLATALRRLNRPPRTALVIDDDPDIVRLYSRMLGEHDSIETVWQAYSGREGMALMDYSPPDVVILDLLMPDVDGFSVIQWMKADARLCEVPVILASARGAGDALTPSAKGSLSITKPDGFQPVELVRCVETLLDSVTLTNVEVL